MDRGVLAASEIVQEEVALEADPAHEGEVPAVRRGSRADGAAGPRDHGLDLAGLTVDAADRVDALGRVPAVLVDAARRRVLAEVDVAPVRREGRFAEVLLLVRLLVQLEARALAARVVEPDLAAADRTRRHEVLARRDEAAVRAPDRVVDEPEVLAADLLRLAATCRDRPDVVAAAPVADEGDPAAVRAEARHHVPRHPVRQRLRVAAADRQQVEVAQQVEDDPLAVRRHVEAHPGAFGRVDLDLVLVAGRVVHVPLLPVLGEGRNGGEHEEQAGGELERKAGARGQACHPASLRPIGSAPAGPGARAARGS